MSTGQWRSRMQAHGTLTAILFVSVATAAMWEIREIYSGFDKSHFTLMYLPVVVLAATVGGVSAGATAAVTAFFFENYFLTAPYFSLDAQADEWFLLAVFLIVGLVVGWQTGRMRDRESYAIEREREISLLYDLSGRLARETHTDAITSALIAQTRQISGNADTVLFLPSGDGSLKPAPDLTPVGSQTAVGVQATAAWIFQQASDSSELMVVDERPKRGVRWPVQVKQHEGSTAKGIFVPLAVGDKVEGILYVGPSAPGVSARVRQEQMLLSISQLGATFLERQRLLMSAAQTEALRSADTLRSTLVSSVSHELKTPLASVTAAVTSLLEGDLEWDPAVIRQELQAITSDLHHLNSSIGELLDLSRLEGGAWTFKMESREMGELIGTVLSRLPIAQRVRTRLDVISDLPAVSVDDVQLVSALTNLVQNGLSYSAPDGIVTIGASADGRWARIWVEDDGPGIDPADLPRLFEKFYRGAAASHAPFGTGLGLAITREIVRFHHGDIQVEAVYPHGSRFVIMLPLEV